MYTILSSRYNSFLSKKKHEKNNQITIDFETPVNKAWWSGIPCQEMQYFDLLSNNIEIEDISKPWEIEDYKKTKICHSTSEDSENKQPVQDSAQYSA